MVRKSKQNWQVGATVKVGFLSLVVLAAVATPGDYMLTNSKGVIYGFVPHNGLTKFDSVEEANQYYA